MKKIIIAVILGLIIANTPVLAQSNIYDYTNRYTYTTGCESVQLGDGSGLTDSVIHFTQGGMLLRWLKEYQTECYNDSNYVCDWRIIITDKDKNGLVHTYDSYDCIWNHKEPTFLGFIEWLDKKLIKYEKDINHSAAIGAGR